MGCYREITAPGAVLAGPGLAAPALHPANALVFELTRVPAATLYESRPLTPA